MSKINKMVKSLEINEKNDNFVFSKFSFNNFKIYFLTKGDYIACGVFSNTKSHAIKIYLLHMYIAFQNFMGDTSKHLKTVIHHDTKNINSNEILHAKIFEVEYYNLDVPRCTYNKSFRKDNKDDNEKRRNVS
jgi:hypothetical protein